MANTYDTSTEPLGSTAVKVLYNNASNLDDAVNALERTWVDRPPFNRTRKTFYGMEQDFADFLLSSGYEFIGDYDADGPLTIERPNQIFSKDGEYWRASPSLELPYTTVNNWVVDQPKFVSTGDAALRQELANGTPYLVDAEVVGYADPVAPAYLKTVSDVINGLPVSAFRFIPVAEHAAIAAGTSDFDVAPNLNEALATGCLIRAPQGVYPVESVMTMVPGGGLQGEGERTQFQRRFTGGQMIRHPGGNQLGSGIILRDFCITKESSVVVASGDTGIDIGYAEAWGGRGDIANILMLHQWDGFKWSGGTMNPIHNVQVLEGKGHGFLGINARGELVGCLAQYNAGNGYFFFAQDQNETGVQLTSTGTFGNQGWGYLFDAASGVIGANIYMKGVSSSTDGTGGIGFVKEYRQIWMTQVLIESAGDAYIPFPDFVVHNDAKGLYMIGGCKQVVGSDIYIQTCRSSGAFFDGLQRASFANLTCIDNGRSGLGGSDAVGVDFNANNVDVSISNLIADFGSSQTTDVSFGSGNQITLDNPTFRTSSGGGSGVRGLHTNTTATKSLSAANPLNIPWYGDIFLISGTTSFATIPASYDGRRITLRFDADLTIFNDGNIKLLANTPAGAGSTIDLICDGTNWWRAG